MTALSGWASSDVRPLFRVVPSNVVDEDLVVQDGWDCALTTLSCWFDDPDVLADEGMDAPSRETLRLARVLAAQARTQGMPPPTRVMPNGEAGIALEWIAGQLRNLWEINAHQQVEMSRFEGAHRASRTCFDLAGLPL